MPRTKKGIAYAMEDPKIENRFFFWQRTGFLGLRILYYNSWLTSDASKDWPANVSYRELFETSEIKWRPKVIEKYFCPYGGFANIPILLDPLNRRWFLFYLVSWVVLLGLLAITLSLGYTFKDFIIEGLVFLVVLSFISFVTKPIVYSKKLHPTIKYLFYLYFGLYFSFLYATNLASKYFDEIDPFISNSDLMLDILFALSAYFIFHIVVIPIFGLHRRIKRKKKERLIEKLSP